MSVTRDDAPLYLAKYARRRAEPEVPLEGDGDEPAFMLRARERSTLRALEELDRVTAPPGRTEEFARETVSPREQFPGEFRKRVTTSIDVRLIRHGQTQGDDDDLALPFLAVTPALNHWHMLAVLRVGDVARQQTVVMRPDLSAEALTYAVKSAPLEVCLRLFDNSTLHLDDRAYHGLYTRFGQVPEMAELLLSRPNLPLDIRILQAKRASNRMQQLMAERGWMADNDASELVADAEETAILRILVDASNDELARAIPFLVAKKMLTPSMIVRAAAIGEMKLVQWSLAHLSGVGLARAHDLMFGRGLMGLKSLHSKSGLPQSCYGLLMAACDVVKDAKEEGLPLDPESFGRRLIEALMTRYENMKTVERSKNLEFIGRFAEDRVRKIAKRLRADMVRAA